MPGSYRVEILKCKEGQTRKGIGFFVVEMKILESSNPRRPVGTTMDWMVTLDKDPALGNIKSFAALATDTPVDEVDGKLVDQLVGESNPLEGIILRMEASDKKTQKGTDFTRIRWLPDAQAA